MSSESLKLTFEVVALIAVGISVVAGAAALVLGNRINKAQTEQLRQFDADVTAAKTELGKQQVRAANSERDAAAAKKAAGEADAKAEGFRRDIAKAEERAAEANAKAESFRLNIAEANEASAQAKAQVAVATAEAAKANLELAKLKTARTLSAEQQKRISSKIEAFPDTPFDLWVSTDSDSTALMSLIDEAIRGGKWQFKPAGIIQFAGKAGIIADSGVSIHFAEEHQDVFEKPALTLANALKEEGIQVKAVFRDSADANKDKNREAIHVMIGSKPLN